MSTWVRLPLAGLLGLAAVLGVPAAPAHAAAYRYWTYWHAAPGSSSWGFAGSGPTYRPSPGAVEGWRFALSAGTASAPAPRTDPAKAYSKACGSRTPDSGHKLVALVLDYGTASDAPPGEKPPGGVEAVCTQVASNGDGFDVLRAAGVSVREKDNLVCGLNGYPRTECAPVVTKSASPTPSRSASRTPSPNPTPSHHSSAAHSPTPSSAPPSTHSSSSVSSVSSPGKTASPTQSPTPPDATSQPLDSAAGAAPAGSASVAAAPSLVVGDVSAGSSHGRPWALVAGVVLLLVLATAGLRARRRS